MRTMIEKVDISITTKKNALPTMKPVAGRFRLSKGLDTASFVEDEDATVIVGVRNGRRIRQGKDCSVYWNPVKEEFRMHLTIGNDSRSIILAECNFEDCLNFIKRRILETNYTTD